MLHDWRCTNQSCASIANYRRWEALRTLREATRWRLTKPRRRTCTASTMSLILQKLGANDKRADSNVSPRWRGPDCLHTCCTRVRCFRGSSPCRSSKISATIVVLSSTRRPILIRARLNGRDQGKLFAKPLEMRRGVLPSSSASASTLIKAPYFSSRIFARVLFVTLRLSSAPVGS